MVKKPAQGGKQRPAFSAHPTRANPVTAAAMGGTSSSVLTHQLGNQAGRQTLVGRTQPINRSSLNWVQPQGGVDYTKVNFGKLTGDATES